MKVNIGPYVNRMMSNVHTHYMNKTYGHIDWPEYGQKGLNNKVEPLKERSLRVTEDTLQWIYNHTINRFYLDRKERRVKIKIHKYDTWSMDHNNRLPNDLYSFVQMPISFHLEPSPNV